jgi:glycosyltransferase involved in cell wall biosynthesis
MSRRNNVDGQTVSILIPCYNSESYVGNAIESALNQTWPHCDVVVVDDGSTDDSLEVARKYQEQGVRVVAQENQGASAARNRAFEEAEGDLIQYLDADDLLHPDKIEAQVCALREAPKGGVAVSPTCYFKNGESPEQGTIRRGGEALDSNDPVQWLIDLWTPGKGWGMVQTGAWLTPRCVLEKAGPWKEAISKDDDGEFFTRVLLSSSGVRCVDETCVYYRQYNGETSRVGNPETREDFKGWVRAIDSKRSHLMPQTTEGQQSPAARALSWQYWAIALRAYPDYPEVAATAEERASELGFSDPLRSVSENGWKGKLAGTVRSLLGWRASRRLQDTYHMLRKTFEGTPPVSNEA